MNTVTHTLCVTLGDPCGLGPELVARHFSSVSDPDGRYLLIGPEDSLKREMDRLGISPFYETVSSPEAVTEKTPGVYLYDPPELEGLDFPEGVACAEGGKGAGVSLDIAVRALLDNIAEGLVTSPLNKAMLQEAGFDFPGHTEFLAEKLGVGRENVCMHLCGHDPESDDPKIRVSLTTTHPPLREVPGLVTRERVLHCLRLTADFVKVLGLTGPIGVCGLNPHAGESGKIGQEEIDVIIPAIEDAQKEGLDVAGPIPGDTIFYFAAKGAYPAVLAMYHDQGLAPMKLLHFDDGVNVTLGLPYPRTSPDHGTGYDLVGMGKASVQSFSSAVDMACRLVANAKDKNV